MFNAKRRKYSQNADKRRRWQKQIEKKQKVGMANAVSLSLYRRMQTFRMPSSNQQYIDFFFLWRAHYLLPTLYAVHVFPRRIK